MLTCPRQILTNSKNMLTFIYYNITEEYNLREKYKNPVAIGAYLGFVLVVTILAISTFFINGYQAMATVGFVGIILFLYSLKDLTKQEIEIEPLVLTTIGGNFGYLLATSLALMLFDQKAIINNYILEIGMSLCFIAIVLLELKLTEIKDDATKKIIKERKKTGS